MNFDEDRYLEDEFFEQSVIRDKCRALGISEEQANALLDQRADAFSITKADLERLTREKHQKKRF